MDLIIREELADDYAVIASITERAFAPMPFSDGDEHELIGKLRDAGVLAISLVAEYEGTVAGHIAYTPAFAADGSANWYALGPVAVEPGLQKRRIGARLIERGLAMLRERDAAGCVLVGDPAYYSRFGFKLYPEFCPEGEPEEYFQILPLRQTAPRSVVGFHPLFSHPS